ncbi:MAG TPA: type II toxin-antitoxin system PemK/MazF family toxin [Xanthomonadales bacterium]|nr:type II toxin-antitoxin system PemK/MazF family toxin [Xanthomonadales bacterium]
MERFVVGDIVVALFPFSDLKGQKLRPALVLAKAEFKNLIICQITSKSYSSKMAVKLIREDFASGTLPITSYIRPDKLFTIDSSIIQKISGKLTIKKQRVISQTLQKMFAV